MVTVSPAPDSEAQSPEENAQHSSDDLLGRCLNDTYILESVIGQGGVGRVYRARHARIATKLFALKVLHAEHSRDPHQLARFQREAEAAAALSHKNVVGVFDIGRTEDGYSYLVCELLEGLDLDAYIEKFGRLSTEMALSVALQTCEALVATHAENVVHRDLKPQNVFLLQDANGEFSSSVAVKLVDFGLSRFLDHGDAKLTKTGALMGTPAFMAPEQATGDRGDHRVDVYGVGVILYAALTGRAPFIEETLPAMLVAVMTEQPARPRKIQPDIPESVELVVQRAMAKQPADRYSTMEELRDALSGLAAGYPEVLPVRGALSSAYQAAEETYELKTSRPRLVFYGLITACIGVFLLAGAVGGLELLVGPFEFTQTELWLIFAGICGTIATPMTLAFRHFSSAIWSNSAKVVDALALLRAPLVAGTIAYGAATMLIRFADEFLGRLSESDLFVQDPGIGWPGFSWVLPGVALVAAAAASLKQRLSRGAQASKRVFWLGAPLLLVTAVLSLCLMGAGLQWRRWDLEQRAKRASEQAAQVAAQLRAKQQEQLKGRPAEAQKASDDELATAMAGGVDGLLPLSEKFPRDPRVLEPLVLAFASRATGFADAMVTARRLLEISPEKRDSETLSLLVRRAADTLGNASDSAFKLMEERMGSTGPDLLYQLTKSSSKVGKRAQDALAREEVQALMSPALRVALALENAKSCEARLPHLHHAQHLGDLRSSSILSPLAKGTSSGCGKSKTRPCPAHCAKYAKQYLEAVRAILSRHSATSHL